MITTTYRFNILQEEWHALLKLLAKEKQLL